MQTQSANENGANKLHLLKSFIMVLFLTALVYGQFSLSSDVYYYRDDNLFRSPDAERDWYNGYSINASYSFSEPGITIYYNPDFYHFDSFSERNFSIQQGGVRYTASPFENERHNLYLGGTFIKRINRTDYDFYNYNQFYFYGNLRFYWDIFVLKTGYNFRSRAYTNLSSLNNIRHYVFAQINKSWPTRTTLMAEIDLGNKSFTGSETITSVSVDTIPIQRGRGRGHRFITNEQTDELNGPSFNQIVFWIRTAQSLHRNIGWYGQYRMQRSLTDDNVIYNSDYYYQDEELFDDPFSYTSDEFSSQLTFILPWQMQLKVNGSYEDKKYLSDRAYVSATDTVGAGGLRADIQRTLSIHWSKTFYMQKQWLNEVYVSFGYYVIRNSSNSYWFDYKNQLLSSGLSVGF
ncbi:MAG: hypothetical protein GF313_01525 [Caldithrix sp.]|nr:hypothetical protein [Caldithrix sp.]